MQRFVEKPPKLHFALPMLGALLISSAVLYWGEKQVKRRNYGRGRILLLMTILMGMVFFRYSILNTANALMPCRRRPTPTVRSSTRSLAFTRRI